MQPQPKAVAIVATHTGLSARAFETIFSKLNGQRQRMPRDQQECVWRFRMTSFSSSGKVRCKYLEQIRTEGNESSFIVRME
jgi:hypothetical protein